MRFVHHDQADAAFTDDAAQRAFEPFGSDVHQFQLAATQLRQGSLALVALQAGVDHGGAKAEPHQRVHLILHERDERRNDQHRSRQDSGRNLEGDRLAGAGRHDADAVAAAQHRIDEMSLAGAELAVPEHLFEHLLRVGHLGGNARRNGRLEHDSSCAGEKRGEHRRRA